MNVGVIDGVVCVLMMLFGVCDFCDVVKNGEMVMDGGCVLLLLILYGRCVI